MDFQKFKEDMVNKIDKEFRFTVTNESELAFSRMKKQSELDIVKLICDTLEEYDKRKNNE